MGIKWDEFFVTGDPLIFASQIGIALTLVGALAGLPVLKNGITFDRSGLQRLTTRRLGLCIFCLAW